MQALEDVTERDTLPSGSSRLSSQGAEVGGTLDRGLRLCISE